MRLGFYPKLAVDGIRKNSRLYIPYIIAIICMVMVQYIITYLGFSKAVNSINGGSFLSVLMNLGAIIIGLFCTIFLFYANGLIMKRRRKEFGLYNILGMGKRHISLIVFWESVILYVFTLVVGLIFGIAFSKFAELGLLKISHIEADLSFSVPVPIIGVTAISFGTIFFLVLLNNLRQVRFSAAINLLKSENVGEKPPKANWFLGILGFVILGIAYYIAVTIEDPVSAVMWFFFAVLLVIIATNMIMVSGSVLLCRILQKNKNYYYKSKHFVSVSSMAFRMKRNGSELASICILATMVLVIISSSSCLYFGANDSINARTPRDIVLMYDYNDIAALTDDNVNNFKTGVDKIISESNVTTDNEVFQSFVQTYGAFDGTNFYMNPETIDFDNKFSDVNLLIVVTADEYKKNTGNEVNLNDDEVLIYSKNVKVSDSITIAESGLTFKVVDRIDEAPVTTVLNASATLSPRFFMVVKDMNVLATFSGLTDSKGETLATFSVSYMFDCEGTEETKTELYNNLKTAEPELSNHPSIRIPYLETKSENQVDFFTTYAGLFYLGIVLSIVFILAAVLIIYYKQITEGYEDHDRFAIMKKVGMTSKDIKRGINSQLLTIFFLPLFGAGLHMAFAFPMVQKLLLLFNLDNISLFVLTTVICFVAFAIIYAIVYKATSNAYYKIVNTRIM